MKTARNEH